MGRATITLQWFSRASANKIVPTLKLKAPNQLLSILAEAILLVDELLQPQRAAFRMQLPTLTNAQPVPITNEKVSSSMQTATQLLTMTTTARLKSHC